MAKITEIEVNRQFVINLGNYESARFGASIKAFLDKDDDPSEQYDMLVAMIEEKIQCDIDVFSD